MVGFNGSDQTVVFYWYLADLLAHLFFVCSVPVIVSVVMMCPPLVVSIIVVLPNNHRTRFMQTEMRCWTRPETIARIDVPVALLHPHHLAGSFLRHLVTQADTEAMRPHGLDYPQASIRQSYGPIFIEGRPQGL